LGLSKSDLDGYIETFVAAIASGSYDSARAALVQAEAVLQTLPVTDQISWRGTLANLFERLEELQNRDSDEVKYIVNQAGFRNKRRSTK
jgi:hypothetical protein